MYGKHHKTTRLVPADSTAAARKLLSASRQLLQTGQGVWGYFYIQGGSLDELRSVNQKWNEVNNNFQGNGLPSILPTVSVVCSYTLSEAAASSMPPAFSRAC